MGFKLVMPKFTETMEEGTIIQWYKEEGESVKKGERLLQIVGEKLTYDVEAPTTGKLLKIYHEKESEVPVGSLIAFLGEEGEEPPSNEERGGVEMKTLMPKKAEAQVAVKPRVVASPLARRTAEKLGVNLAQVKGTGPGGRITGADVKKAVEKIGMEEGREVKEIIPLIGVRKTIAERMAASSMVPRTTLSMDVDAGSLLKFQRFYETLEGVKASLTPLLVKVVAEALKKHRIINSTLEGDEVKVFENVNVGVAVATDYGLVVPVIKDAHEKSLRKIIEETESLVEKAKRNVLTGDDVYGGTFTVTNLGMFEVDTFTPLINPPECAILGVGRIKGSPAVVDGGIVVRSTMSLSLSFDHRIVDGVPAARFLQTIKNLLEGNFNSL